MATRTFKLLFEVFSSVVSILCSAWYHSLKQNSSNLLNLYTVTRWMGAWKMKNPQEIPKPLVPWITIYLHFRFRQFHWTDFNPLFLYQSNPLTLITLLQNAEREYHDTQPDGLNPCPGWTVFTLQVGHPNAHLANWRLVLLPPTASECKGISQCDFWCDRGLLWRVKQHVQHFFLHTIHVVKGNKSSAYIRNRLVCISSVSWKGKEELSRDSLRMELIANFPSFYRGLVMTVRCSKNDQVK